ncbi:MAG TPA: response regulator [Chitinophagales bacterium]|nr:response regulator [Chitinophagales bacterium]
MLSDKVKVLLIEDNPGDARLVEIFLRESPIIEFELTHVMRLQEGFDLSAKGHDFDIILLDLHLPDSKGFDTLLKAAENFPRSSSIVVLTGLDDESLGIKAVEAGAQDYLVKGEIETTTLTRSVLHAIHRKKMLLEVQTTARNLKLSEERLLLAQRIAHIGNYEYLPEDNYLYWSEEIENILSITKQQITSTNLTQLFTQLIALPGQAETTLLPYIQLVQQKQTGFDFEHRLVNSNPHQPKFFRNRGQIEYHPQTGKIQRITGAIQDISAYRQTVEMLEQSRKRYQIVFEESQDAIFITNAQGIFTEFNNSILHLFNLTRQQLLKATFKSLFAKPEQWDAFYSQLQKANAAKDFEIAFLRPNGEVIDGAVTANLWKSINGEVMGFHGIIRDITTAKRTQELIKAKDVAEQSARMKEQFLANMSHEIRTPMNVVVGMAHLIENTPLSPKQAEYVNALKLSADNLLRLINNILDFSKIEAGKIELEKRPFNLRSLINDLIATYKFKAHEKQNQLFTQLDAALPDTIVGDSVRLYQVLNNLLSNAIKYTVKGEVLLKALLKNSTDFTLEIEFSVKDTGIGISPDKKDKIFESFTQASDDTTRLYGGTGLGLTIAKNLAELMGGNMRLESEPNKGATFSFNAFFETAHESQAYDDILNDHLKLLPAALVSGNLPQVKVYADEEQLSVASKEQLLPPDTPINLLLVEDHRLNQLVASDLLKKWSDKITIHIANNGQEAIEALQEKGNFYHVVLMDISMPVMDGYEATEYIRNKLPAPVCHIPIIAMTAHAFNTNAQRCFDAGMNEFVTKPINPDALYAKLNKVLALILPNQQNTNTNQIPTTAETPAAGTLTNLDYLKSLSGDDEDTLLLMLETIVADLPNEIATLKKHGAAHNWQELKAIAHKLKSTCAYMGMDTMRELAKSIENQIWENKINPTQLQQWVQTLAATCLNAHFELLDTVEKMKVKVTN